MTLAGLCAAFAWGCGRDTSLDVIGHVAQPMEPAEHVSFRVVPVSVPYVFNHDGPWPGLEVQYTCSPAPLHRVRRRFDEAHREDLDVEDWNVAHAAGLTIQVENRSEPATWNSPDSDPPGSRWGRKGKVPPSLGSIDTLQVRLMTQEAFDRLRLGPKVARRDSMRLYRLDAIVLSTIDCIRINASASARVPIRHVQLVVEGPPRYRALSGLLRIDPAREEAKARSYPMDD